MQPSDFVAVAKALADPTRHQIVRELRRAGSMTCSDVCARFPLSQPTISHHIRTLEEAGLLDVSREGQFHVLRLKEGVLRRFVDELGSSGDATPPASRQTDAGGSGEDADPGRRAEPSSRRKPRGESGSTGSERAAAGPRAPGRRPAR